MSDWIPFLRNSSRVRTWHDRSFNDSLYLLSREALNDIGIHRPTTEIFPRLTKVLIGTRELEPFLMVPTVRSLDLLVRHLPEDNVSESRTVAVFRNVADRLTQLTELNIFYVDDDTPNYDAQIIGLLRKLPKLQLLTLPILCLDATIADALAGHQDLRRIKFDDTEPIALYRCAEDARFLFDPTRTLPYDAFPSLSSIQFSTVSLRDAASFLFQSGSPLRRLNQLFVHTRIVPSSEDIGLFIERLATEGLLLKDLTLAFHALKYDPSNASALTSPARLEFRHLATVLHISGLTTLVIRHPHPVDMNDNDVAKLAVGCPHLQNIHLNPFPIVTTRPNISYRALRHFAENCPELKSIGLYIDGRRISKPKGSPTQRLKVILTLGHSPLPILEDTATEHYPTIVRYLASVLSKSCAWDWEDAAFVAESIDPDEWHLPGINIHDDLDDYRRGWKMIAAMTKMLGEEKRKILKKSKDVTGDEAVGLRKKYDALEDENALLRAKYEALLRKDT